MKPWIRGVVLGAALHTGVSAESTAQHVSPDASPSGSAQTREQRRTITLSLANVTIHDALKAIAREAGATLILNGNDSALQRVLATRTTVKFVAESPDNAATTVLQHTKFHAHLSRDGRMLMISGAHGAPASDSVVQNSGKVTGAIFDSTANRRIPGVSISIVGTTWSAVSNENGTFEISGVPPGEYTIVARMLGYTSRSVHVRIAAGQAVTLRIVLSQTASVLSEIVTTAAGNQKRLEVGNSVTTLNVDSIVKNTAVTSLTDVLDGSRVPGLIVTRSSGAPGAPARVRIRGIGSVNASNDPIIIVDGVRIYSDQTDTEANAQYSVLDRIDINTIQKVEVLKGPSASALYGSDASNGIIVITTKSGQAGKTQWRFRADRQWTTQPGRFEDRYYREGTPPEGGMPTHCPLGEGSCSDAVVYRYNPLSDKSTTIFGTGWRDRFSGSVSGGTDAVRFDVTLSANNDHGLLKMPDRDVKLLERLTGANVPAWTQRPQQNSDASVTGRFDLTPIQALQVSLTTTIGQSTRETTPLSSAIALYTKGSIKDTSIIMGSIIDFRQREIHRQRSMRNAVNANWTGWKQITLSADAGYDASIRDSRRVLRRGDCANYGYADGRGPCWSGDSSTALMIGRLISDRAQKGVFSMNLNGGMSLPSRWGLSVKPYFGLNLNQESNDQYNISAYGLAYGSSESGSADSIRARDEMTRRSLVGAFVGARLALFDRLYWSVGMRTDASNALGSQVRPSYPKLDLSYLISEERWFPKQISQLRLRLAYGHSAVQPQLGERDRAYGLSSERELVVKTIGNQYLKPERSVELETGFDVGLFDSRAMISMTVARKRSRDALVRVESPQSLGGSLIGSITTNLGSVLNESFETSADLILVDSRDFRWGVTTTVSAFRNRLVSIVDNSQNGIAGALISAGLSGVFRQRYVVGYPLGGYWIRPVIAYEDLNSDGVITFNELLRADSSVYVGWNQPNFTAGWSTSVGILNQRVSVGVSGFYTNGLVQLNQPALQTLCSVPSRCNGQTSGTNSVLRAINDPASSIDEQAAVRSGHAFVHTVSTFQIASLSITANVPTHIANRLRANSMTLALQADNLALWTNYSGIDPNVNESIVGNRTVDNGQLPRPRTWGIRVSLTY